MEACKRLKEPERVWKKVKTESGLTAENAREILDRETRGMRERRKGKERRLSGGGVTRG